MRRTPFLLGLGLAGCVHREPVAAPETVDVHTVVAEPLQVVAPPPAVAAAPTNPPYTGPAADEEPTDDSPVYGDAKYSTYSRVAGWQALHKVSLAHCQAPGGPSGPALIQLTITKTGAITSTTWIAGPYANTPTGACIQKAFVDAKLPTFTGLDVHVQKIVNLQ